MIIAVTIIAATAAAIITANLVSYLILSVFTATADNSKEE